jgi:acetoin reductase-like protein
MFRRTATTLASTPVRLFSTSGPVRRTAIVTGGSRGIGKAISLRLARDGYAVTVNDVPANQPLIDETVAEIENQGGRAYGHAADVTSSEAVDDLVRASVGSLGPLSTMIANAGICQVKSLLDITPADLDRLLAVNVGGVHNCFRAAARQMIEQGSPGKLIAAASVASFRPFPGLGHYSATKWAVRGLCHAWAAELAQHKITVNAYAPGVVGTAMWDLIDEAMAERQGKKKGEVFEGLKNNIMLGRTSVPEDVAKLVGFLASEDADYITAQTYIVDGGIQNS